MFALLHSRERAAAGPACSMSTVVLASLGAVAVGMGGVLQVGVNSVLAGLLGHQLPAAFVSFAGGSADASNPPVLVWWAYFDSFRVVPAVGLALVHGSAYSWLRWGRTASEGGSPPPTKPEFNCAGLRPHELTGGVLVKFTSNLPLADLSGLFWGIALCLLRGTGVLGDGAQSAGLSDAGLRTVKHHADRRP